MSSLDNYNHPHFGGSMPYPGLSRSMVAKIIMEAIEQVIAPVAGLMGGNLTEASELSQRTANADVASNRKLPATNHVPIAETSVFDGVVESIDGDAAAITLRNCDTGEILHASGKTSEMAASDLTTGDRFRMTVTQTHAESTVRLQKVAREKLSAASLNALAEKFAHLAGH